MQHNDCFFMTVVGIWRWMDLPGVGSYQIRELALKYPADVVKQKLAARENKKR